MILNSLVSVVQTDTHHASAWVDDVSHDVEARLDRRSVEGGPLGHGKHCLSYVSDNNLSVSSRGSSGTCTTVRIDGSTTRASVHFADIWDEVTTCFCSFSDRRFLGFQLLMTLIVFSCSLTLWFVPNFDNLGKKPRTFSLSLSNSHYHSSL